MGKDGVDISPTQSPGVPGDKMVSQLWPFQRDRQSVPVRPSDDNCPGLLKRPGSPQHRPRHPHSGWRQEARGGGSPRGPLPFPRAEGGAARPVAGGNGRVTGGRSVGYRRPPYLQGP